MSDGARFGSFGRSKNQLFYTRIMTISYKKNKVNTKGTYDENKYQKRL